MLCSKTVRYVFPQVSVRSSAPGPTVARSSHVLTSWPVTTAHTLARSVSTVQCVTSASWGATTWLNTPGDTQASIPACSRAPEQPNAAATLYPCLRLSLETKALLECEHTQCCTCIHDAQTQGSTQSHLCALRTLHKSSPVTKLNQPDHYTHSLCMHVTLYQQTWASSLAWLYNTPALFFFSWHDWYLLREFGSFRSFIAFPFVCVVLHMYI